MCATVVLLRSDAAVTLAQFLCAISLRNSNLSLNSIDYYSINLQGKKKRRIARRRRRRRARRRRRTRWDQNPGALVQTSLMVGLLNQRLDHHHVRPLRFPKKTLDSILILNWRAAQWLSRCLFKIPSAVQHSQFFNNMLIIKHVAIVHTVRPFESSKAMWCTIINYNRCHHRSSQIWHFIFVSSSVSSSTLVELCTTQLLCHHAPLAWHWLQHLQLHLQHHTGPSLKIKKKGSKKGKADGDGPKRRKSSKKGKGGTDGYANVGPGGQLGKAFTDAQ